MNENLFSYRIQFIEHLNSFSTNKKSLGSASSYALRHYDCYEELFDCLLEEFTDMKSSSLYLKNLFILLENICTVTMNNSWFGYKNCFERYIKKILVCIFHPKRVLDCHISYIIKLLKVICYREWFTDETIQYIEKVIQKYTDQAVLAKDDKLIDKNELFERMEEEREYQKKLREHLWLRKINEPKYNEMEEIFDTVEGIITEEDEKDLHCQLEKYQKAQKLWK